MSRSGARPPRSGFVPFEEFLERTDAARPESFPAPRQGAVGGLEAAPRGADVADRARAEFGAMKAHILTFYEGVEVEHSFVDDGALHVDCIRVGAQPGPEAGPGPRAGVAEPPAFRDVPGAPAITPRAAVRGPLAEEVTDPFGHARFCPEGFVPVLRVSLERMIAAGSMAGFFQKAPDGGRHPMLGSGRTRRPPAPGGGPMAPMQEVGRAIHAYAHAFQLVPNRGGRSWLNVWAPDPAPGVFSLSQQWYAGGQGAGLQTVEGGWHVYPDFYQGSTLARLFTYFTADGYQATGSYNLDRRPGQGGFIQTDNTWVLGGSFAASTPGGDQKGFLMQWQRDDAGNWWLFLQGAGDPAAVGYYPRSLFGGGPLTQYASSVDFGGEVCSRPGIGRTGPMGSGRPAADGWRRAAFHKLIAYLAPDGVMAPAALVPDVRDAPGYTFDLHTAGPGTWSTYFFFGGPGSRWG